MIIVLNDVDPFIIGCANCLPDGTDATFPSRLVTFHFTLIAAMKDLEQPSDSHFINFLPRVRVVILCLSVA